MKDYLITFDCNGWQKNYDGIYAAINQLSTEGVKVGSTTCVIKSVYNAQTIRDTLLNFMDIDDELFVTGMGEDAAWYRPKTDQIHEWLGRKLFINN